MEETPESRIAFLMEIVYYSAVVQRLSRLPVTQKIAGSSPVSTARIGVWGFRNLWRVKGPASQREKDSHNGHQHSWLMHSADNRKMLGPNPRCPTNDMDSEIHLGYTTQQIQCYSDGFSTFGFPLSFHFRHAQQTFLAFVKWLRRFPFKKITLVRIRQANNVSSILKRMFQ